MYKEINWRGALIAGGAFLAMEGTFVPLNGGFDFRCTLIFAVGSVALGWGKTIGWTRWKQRPRTTR